MKIGVLIMFKIIFFFSSGHSWYISYKILKYFLYQLGPQDTVELTIKKLKQKQREDTRVLYIT